MAEKLVLSFNAILLLASLLILSSCGGGGGGGDTVAITYSGNTDQAVVTTNNAATLVSNVMGDAAASGGITASRGIAGAPSQNVDQVRLAHQLNQHLRDTMMQTVAAQPAKLRTSAKIDVDETDPCESGSIRITGTLNDDGKGTVTATYNNCRFSDEKLNGQATIRIDGFNFDFFIITNATYSFSALTLTTSNFSVSLSGSIHSRIFISPNTERLTVNIVTRDNGSSHMTKTENLMIVDVYDDVLSPNSFSETISGRVFDSVHGFVDISTLAPLIFSTINQFFSNSGQLVLSGAGSTSIRVTTVSASIVVLELDLDGDSTHEIAATLRWVDLTDEAGSDLVDSDVDGMHDSWELANDLDPLNPVDADQDADSDGFSNINEYLAGSNPNDGGSIPPPSADLSIAITDSADPVAVNATFSYGLMVSNPGPIDAIGVKVQDTLPDGVSYVSDSGGGHCNHSAGIVTCTSTFLVAGGQWAITVAVSAPSIGDTVSNTASVSTDTIDFNPSNNSATETTVVMLDLIPPTAPTVSVAVNADRSVTISWSPSSDDNGIREYRVRRSIMPIARTSDTTFTDREVEPGTIVDYYVRAVDNAGNVSTLMPRQTVSIPSTGASVFDPPVSGTLGSIPTSNFSGMGVADVDGDGNRDLVVMGYTALGPLSAGVLFTPSSVSIPHIVNNDDNIPSFHLTNIIGDNLPELLGNFKTFAWDSAGEVWGEASGDQPSNFSARTYIDLNNDEILDIISGESGFENAKLLGFQGFGNGAYLITGTELASIGDIVLRDLRGPITATDVDRDGLADLVVWDEDTIRIIRQTSPGIFSVTSNLLATNTRYFRVALLVTDVTGDGYPEVIYAHYADSINALRIYVNDGTGNFGSTAVSSGVPEPWNLAAGDINGDGIQDLVVGNRLSHDLDLYISQGDGTFAFSSSINDVGYPFLKLSDIDRDGGIDIIAAGASPGPDFNIYINQ